MDLLSGRSPWTLRSPSARWEGAPGMRRGAGGQSRGFSCDEVVPALPSARGVNERGARLGGSTPLPGAGTLDPTRVAFLQLGFPAQT